MKRFRCVREITRVCGNKRSAVKGMVVRVLNVLYERMVAPGADALGKGFIYPQDHSSRSRVRSTASVSGGRAAPSQGILVQGPFASGFTMDLGRNGG